MPAIDRSFSDCIYMPAIDRSFSECRSVPITTDVFKYGSDFAFQAVSTNCDMLSTPYLKEHCEACSYDCMYELQ